MLYESVSEYRAQRLHKDRAHGNETSLEKIYLKEDISIAMDAMISARMGTGGAQRKAGGGGGGGGGAHADPFAELNGLYRMDKVKEKLQQLQNTYIIANRDGEDPPPLGHFIFTGSPGTGKTSGKYHRYQSRHLYQIVISCIHMPIYNYLQCSRPSHFKYSVRLGAHCTQTR